MSTADVVFMNGLDLEDPTEQFRVEGLERELREAGLARIELHGRPRIVRGSRRHTDDGPIRG